MYSHADNGRERTEQILHAATTVFARLGFQQARMEDIARQANLGKGTLYLYFDSKDAMITALMRRLFDIELKGMARRLADPAPAAGCLLAVTREVARGVAEMAAQLPIAWEFYAVAARQASVRAFFRSYFRTYRRVLARFLRARMARGELRRADPQQVAITITALYEGLALLCFTDPKAADWEAQSVAAMQLVLDGLQQRDGKGNLDALKRNRHRRSRQRP